MIATFLLKCSSVRIRSAVCLVSGTFFESRRREREGMEGRKEAFEGERRDGQREEECKLSRFALWPSSVLLLLPRWRAKVSNLVRAGLRSSGKGKIMEPLRFAAPFFDLQQHFRCNNTITVCSRGPLRSKRTTQCAHSAAVPSQNSKERVEIQFRNRD